MAGVPFEDGFSEKVMEDGLEGTDDDGRELEVPVGEPSGVNTAGRSVVAFVRWVNWPLMFRSRGSVFWNACVASYGCMRAGGMTCNVGTDRAAYWVLGSGFWVLVAGSGSGSCCWRMEKTRLKKDRVRTALVTTWMGGDLSER